MDPNIMKLLEDDEDDAMHSGADVEAFAAALNRDLGGGGGGGGGGGDTSSTSQPPESQSDPGLLPHGSSSMSNQLPTQLQDSNKEDNSNNSENKDEVKNSQHQDNSSEMETMQPEPVSGNHSQCVGTSQESKNIQLESQHKHEQLEQQAAQRPQTSQKGGLQVSEQNISHFGEVDRMSQPEKQQQYPKSQKMENQQMPAAEPESRNKQVAFGMLLPVITPHLDKDRAMQLQTLYSKLRKNEIQKDGFVRHMRSIVGDQMLRQAVQKVQMQQTKPQSAQNLQIASHQPQAQSQSSSLPQQQVNMSSLNASQFKDSQTFSQLHQKGHRVPADPTPNLAVKVEVPSGSSFPHREGDAQKRDEHKSDSQGVQVNQASSSMGAGNQDKVPASQGLNKHQQQHLRPQQTSYPMYGAHMTNYHTHPYSGQSVGVPSTSLKHQAQDTQVRQVSLHQGMIPTQLGGTTQPMSSTNTQNYEIQNSGAESKRSQASPFSQLTTQPTLQNNSASWQSSVANDRKGTSMSSMPYVKQEALGQSQEQHKSQISASSSSTSFGSGKIDQGIPATPVTNSFPVSLPTQLDSLVPVRTQVSSTTTSLGPGTNIKTPPKKPTTGQKRPLDAFGTPPSSASKKQKSGGHLGVEQLNDVTTVSGVDLREEEEQLFAGPKEESRVSEATRRVVQEEEEKLILEKIPFQKKMANIMSKCGIKSANKDVERCLSLCLEERIRGIISDLIRVSKKRADIERRRHRIIVTSDVGRQLQVLNQKSKEDLEKKQAEEAEKLRKTSEADGNTGGDDEKDKDEGRSKPIKANKEEDEKMKTNAANVAARVAVGGDDMLSKWQLMAEQARQKREGVDSTSVNQIGKDLSRKSSSTTGKTSRETQDGENRSTSTAVTSGSTKKFGRNPAIMPHTKVARTISIKDVIALLEREQPTARSTYLSRLFERNCPPRTPE